MEIKRLDLEITGNKKLISQYYASPFFFCFKELHMDEKKTAVETG